MAIRQITPITMLKTITDVIHWLWTKIWDWPPLAFIVGTICIGVGIALAQEQMYSLSRGLIVFGAFAVAMKIVHDAVTERRPKKEIAIASLISVAVLAAIAAGGWWVIAQIEWNHEVVVKMTFKSSSVLTKRRQKRIIWEINEYYRYLTQLGLDLPNEIPPLGLSPPHGVMLGGGSQGPAYYSSLIIPEDVIDDPNMVRADYSSYTFNRILVWPDAYKTTMTRAEAEDDEIAAWIYSCYYPASFSGQSVCGKDVPGRKWTDAIWDIRQKYGQEYADKLMGYPLKMWRDLPPKYIENFDEFFRYKLTSGESVVDNSGDMRHNIDEILRRHEIDITQP